MTLGKSGVSSSVATTALELGVRGEPLTHLLLQGTIPQSNGTAIPNDDPAVVGQLNGLTRPRNAATAAYSSIGLLASIAVSASPARGA